MNKDQLELLSGQSEKLKVTFNPENADDEKDVKWTSDNQEIATVDADGIVTAVKEGSVVITAEATDGGRKANCKVTVKGLPLDSIAIKEKVTPLKEGETAHLEVIFNPDNAMGDQVVE